MAYVIGIDIGGTFTDAFVADESGRWPPAKSPSTPPDFSRKACSTPSTSSPGRWSRYCVAAAPTPTTSAWHHLHAERAGHRRRRRGRVPHHSGPRRLDRDHEPGGSLRRAGLRLRQEHDPHTKPAPLVPRGRIREIDRADRQKGAVDRAARRGSRPRRDRGADRRRRRGLRGLAALVLPQPRARAAAARAGPRAGSGRLRGPVERAQPADPGVRRATSPRS